MKLLFSFLCVSGSLHGKSLDSIYVVFNYDTSMRQIWVADFPLNAKSTHLNEKEVKQIDKIPTECIEKHNTVQRKEFEKLKGGNPNAKVDRYLISLNGYKIQLVPFMNPKGEKEVWLNAFCKPVWQWKTVLFDPDIVADGGSHYFHVKINLKKKSYYGFGMNSAA